MYLRTGASDGTALSGRGAFVGGTAAIVCDRGMAAPSSVQAAKVSGACARNARLELFIVEGKGEWGRPKGETERGGTGDTGYAKWEGNGPRCQFPFPVSRIPIPPLSVSLFPLPPSQFPVSVR